MWCQRLLVALCLAVVGSVRAVPAVETAEVAGDGSVCYKDCSGHGVCINYQCHCLTGYQGEDCATRLVDHDAVPIPILSAGHYNLSCSNITAAGRRAEVLFVGFSSRACARCVRFENAYHGAAVEMQNMGVDFARADAEACRDIASELGVEDLPAIVVFRGRRSAVYSGPHTKRSLIAFASKQTDPPLLRLDTAIQFVQFVAHPGGEHDEVNPESFAVVFVARDLEEAEDELEDVQEAAKRLVSATDVYMAYTDNERVVRELRRRGLVTSAPHLLLFRKDVRARTVEGSERVPISSSVWGRFDQVGTDVKTLDVESFYGKQSIAEWVTQRAVPLAGQLTPANFQRYEATQLPMLMMFLHFDGFDPEARTGGTSGGVPNAQLLSALTAAAKRFEGKLVFVFIDGVAHADRMRSVGLQGGVDNLPGIALNVQDDRLLVFPPKRKVTEASLTRFCNDFLAGRLKPAAVPARHGQAKAPVEERKGVRELFHPEDASIILPITRASWAQRALDGTRDVLVLFHAIDCEPCMSVAPYYKKMARQFQRHRVEGLVVARYDVTDQAPPKEISLSSLPAIVLLQAFNKNPPFAFYSGVTKVGPMMQWVRAHSGLEMDLPELPQFTEHERDLFKVQMRERHDYFERKLQEAARGGAAVKEGHGSSANAKKGSSVKRKGGKGKRSDGKRRQKGKAKRKRGKGKRRRRKATE